MQKIPEIPKLLIHKNEETGRTTSFRSTLPKSNRSQHPHLIFLHGFNGSSKSWAYQLEYFREYGSIAIDSPGFGGSSRVDDGMDAVVVEVVNLITSLKINNPIIVGHSMGGMTAQVLAAKHPELCSALVLSCTHKGHGAPIGSPLSKDIEQRIEQRKELDNKQYGELRVRKMLGDHVSPLLFDFLVNIAGDITIEGLKCGGVAMQTLDTTPMLSSIRSPVTVITAQRDIVVSNDASAALLRDLPKHRKVELRGVGHAPYCEDPQAFNKVIEEVIATI